MGYSWQLWTWHLIAKVQRLLGSLWSFPPMPYLPYGPSPLCHICHVTLKQTNFLPGPLPHTWQNSVITLLAVSDVGSPLMCLRVCFSFHYTPTHFIWTTRMAVATGDTPIIQWRPLPILLFST